MCNFVKFVFTYLFVTIGVNIVSLYIKLIKLDEDILCEYCHDEGIHQEYDYIIVGAGTAGSTIAGSLSLNTGYKILVLEAGGIGRTLFDVPIFGPMLQGTEYDWQYETVSQNKSCLALQGQIAKWPMGKIVGGSSRLNNMLHVRGNYLDYKDWFHPENYVEDVISTFSKIESYMPVNDLLYASSFKELFTQSGHEAGYLNNKSDNTGFFKIKLNQINGTRYTSSHHYLLKKDKNPNITLLDNSEAIKLLIKNNLVYGVRYIRNNKIMVSRSRRGVILTAGVIGTPKLLMLSGIGPREHLEHLNIPVIADLPVGDNLQDHITTGLDLIVVNSTLGLSLMDFVSPKSFYNYFMGYGGPLSSPGCEGVAFLNTNGVTENAPPDLQLMGMPLGMTIDAGVHLNKLFGIKPDVWSKYFYDLSFKNTITILPVVLHPKSKGNVRLSSNDYSSKPLIDPKYLSDTKDVDVLIKGVRIIQKLLATNSMRKIDAHIEKKKFPGCETFIFDTNDYWECYIRHMTITSFHPAGTCRMGSYGDPEVVVDNKTFKVKGFKNLFVADASVFPNLPSGNVNSAVMLVAERFVKYLLEMKDFVDTREESCHAKNIFLDYFKCSVRYILYPTHLS